MAKNKFSNLSGIKLYNALLRELGEANKNAKGKQRLSVGQKRKIVSEELYPKFKKAPKVLVGQVKKDISGIIKGLPPSEICNPLFLSEAYLAFVEYYEIDNHIRRVLPECLDVRVNGGSYGITRIFNTSNYSYYTNGVQKIIENIRKDVDNNSGRAYFSGIVKLKPRRKDNGDGANYFVDYVLYINDTPEADDEGTSFALPSKESGKVQEVKDYLLVKFKELEKEKKKRRRQSKKVKEEKKKQEPKEQKKITNQAIQNAIASYRLLLKNKIISKDEFERQKADLLKRKK